MLVWAQNKPAKYGLKLMCLIDTRNSYFFSAYLCARKSADGIGLEEEDKNMLNLDNPVFIWLSQSRAQTEI
jgi:hypothetical protein